MRATIAEIEIVPIFIILSDRRGACIVSMTKVIRVQLVNSPAHDRPSNAAGSKTSLSSEVELRPHASPFCSSE